MTIKLNAATGGGSVSLSAPNSTTSNLDVALTLPVDDGTSGQVLQTDGSGVLSWATASSDKITEGNTTAEVIDTGSDGRFVVTTEGTERLRCDASGRLLVGTSTARSNIYYTTNATTPPIQAEVATNSYSAGISLINYSASGYNPALTLGASSSNTLGTNTALGGSYGLGAINFVGADGTDFRVGASIVAVNDQGGAWASGDCPARLVFSTTADAASSPTERMRINSNGCFKASRNGSYYNATNEEHEFNNQTSGVWNLRARHTASSDPRGFAIEYSAAAPNNTGSEFLYCLDNSALRVALRSNGGIANYSANNANLCDEREKKNIVDLDSTWDCLKQWELKKFHYNEDADTDDKRYGVIAQQVADHCPEVITEWVKQKAEDAVLDDDGNVVTPAKEEIVRMGVKEQQMYWMAIKALQEAQVRIETLETANASLEARLTALEGGAS